MDALNQKASVGVVILAAGASSRMGKPKMLLPWRGTTVIGHLVSQWQQLRAGQIIVIHRTNDVLLLTELSRLNFPIENCVVNPSPEQGMFSSIISAANWSGWRNEISQWAIVLGDQPHLRLKTLDALLTFAAQNSGSICQPMFSGHTGHPVILPRAAFSELKGTRANTLKEFLNLASTPRVHIDINDDGLSLDMDTPEDYKKALSLDA